MKAERPKLFPPSQIWDSGNRLTDSADLFTRILDLAEDAIISVDENQTIVQYNQGAEKIFGYSAQEALGKPLDVLLPLRLMDRHGHYLQFFAESSSAARGMAQRREVIGRRKDGTEFPAEGSISKVSLRGETIFTVILRDVTQHALAESLLKASLREKEVLLKEVHHRVKNNLQVVSSLLGLQARSIADPLTRKKFEESQNRIQSMALLHERLYQSEDLARIDFADYLSQLANQLLVFYGAGTRIRLHTNLEPMRVDMDTAVPCGLIVNELVSNSLKYGFPAGRSGDVRLELQRLLPGKATLVVADNGTGLPPELDLLTVRSLGLRLVRTLGEQLGATVHLDGKHGTVFAIHFPFQEPGAEERLRQWLTES
jgi:PAS domain S-box-containing protein